MKKVKKGFTLIELLLVIALMGILTIGSASVFFSYIKAQALQTGVSDVVAALNKAKSRAVSQVKTPDCAGKALQGYQFWHPSGGNYTRLSIKCDGAYYVVERKNLPSGITFDVADPTTTVFFNVATGIVDSIITITVDGNNTTRTITVDAVGNISTQ